MQREEQFPILGGDRELLTSVPMWMVKMHEDQARANHGGKSVAVLAMRSGLSLCEMAAILEDRPWRAMPQSDALAVVRHQISQHAAISD